MKYKHKVVTFIITIVLVWMLLVSEVYGRGGRGGRGGASRGSAGAGAGEVTRRR